MEKIHGAINGMINQAMSGYAPNVAVVGHITSLSPLKINIENGLEITEDVIILSPLVKEYRSDHWKHDHDGATSEDLEDVQVWRGLEVGDKVWMLKANTSTFIVLFREDGQDD